MKKVIAASSLKKKERRLQKKLILSNLRTKEIAITEEELEFFTAYPDELEKMTSTLTAKKTYLVLATGLGFILVALSIVIRYNRIFDDGILHGFGTDLLFEGGVALWGAAITVYLLEIVLDNQTDINEAYRQAVLDRLEERTKRNE